MQTNRFKRFYRLAHLRLPMRWSSLPTALGLAANSLVTQAATLPVPNAGGLLQAVQVQADTQPLKSDLQLHTLPAAELVLPAGTALEVTAFEISGNSIFDSATLQALVASGKGQSLTLAQLHVLVARITAHYRQAGYALARAYLPQQSTQGGTLRIEVLEPRLDAVRITNHSDVSSAFLEQTLSNLPRGEVIRDQDFQGLLLRLSDVLGTHASAELQPNQTPGGADLAVEVQAGAAGQAAVALDNYGGRYTGRERLSATLQWYNPLHRGDVLGVAALTTGPRLNYGRLNYEVPLDGQGDTLGAALSSLHYTLGDSATSLQAHGSAEQGSVWLGKSILRSKDNNLSARLQYDSLTLRDDADASATASQADRSLTLWTAQAQLDVRDTLLGGGLNVASLALHGGSVHFDNTASALLDAQTARTSGDFSYGGLSLARTQSLGTTTSLALTYRGQWSQGNLDASQKFNLGGARNVRAYESDALSGDSGQALSLELRQDLPWLTQFGNNGQWQALLFCDAGQVHVSQNVWNTGANNADISGAGLGLSWRGPRGLHVRLTYATALGSAPSQLSGADATHEALWLELGADF